MHRVKISKKSEYAVRALIKMAQRAREGVFWQQISQIAELTEIPEKFLEQILLNLKNAGFLKSRRGIEGGYSLNLPEGQITLDQVLLALEGPQSYVGPGEAGDSDVLAVFGEAIRQAEKASQAQLRGKNLAMLVDEVQARTISRNRASEYQI